MSASVRLQKCWRLLVSAHVCVCSLLDCVGVVFVFSAVVEPIIRVRIISLGAEILN